MRIQTHRQLSGHFSAACARIINQGTSDFCKALQHALVFTLVLGERWIVMPVHEELFVVEVLSRFGDQTI
jgi:hypothetical protein